MNNFEYADREKTAIQLLPGVSGVALRKLKREEILNNEESLRLLMIATGDRLRAFEDAVGMYQHLPNDRPIRVLVDFDILFTLMEIENAERRDALFVHYFFRESSLNYGIPLGAYHELLNYLNREIMGGHNNLRLSDLRTGNPLDHLAKVLNVEVEELIRPASRQRIEGRLTIRTARIVRLLDAITHERCGGVYSDFDDTEVEQMEAFLQRHTRYAYTKEARRIDESRDKRDNCDSINLCVVLKQQMLCESLNQRASAGVEHYVLMTLTSPVVNVSKDLARIRNRRWMAVYPRQMLIPDILGCDKNRHVGRARAKTIRDILRELGSKLENQLEWSGSPEFEDIIKAEGTRVEQLLDDLQGTASRLVAGEFISVEQIRAQLLSVEHAHQRQLISPVTDVPGLRPKFGAFLKILDRLSEKLRTIEGYRYKIDLVQAPPHARFKQYAIRSAIKTNDESYIVICVHLDADNNHQFWTACWDVTCDEREFLYALDESLSMNVWSTEVLEASPNQTVFPVLSADSNLWNEGIVVSTSVGAFGLHPQTVTRENSWLTLSLPRLQKHLEKVLNINESQYQGIRPAIQEIRINTIWADIVFDITPREETFRRRLTILSHKRIHSFLAHFHDLLGTRLTVRKSIESACEEVLKGFTAVDVPFLRRHT